MKRIFYVFGIFILALLGAAINSYGQHVPPRAKMGLHIYPFNAKNNTILKNRVQLKNNTLLKTNNTSSCSNDSVVLTRQSQIDSFPITNPDCSVLRKLIIDGAGASPAITRLDSLINISQVTQNLSISYTSINNLSALNKLRVIGDSLKLEHNPLLTTIGFNSNLFGELGTIYFVDLPSLTSLAGLCDNYDVYNTINNLHIDSTGLTSLQGLGALHNVVGNYDCFQIFHTPITSLSALINLTNVNGYIWLDSDSAITSIGLNNLAQTYGFLFGNLPRLTTLAGLTAHLTNTDISTFWMINTGLTDLTGLDRLTSSYNFYLFSDPNLTSLHGLEGLTGDVSGGLSISDNDSLTSIGALNNITSLSDGTLFISNSNQLANLNGIGNITNIGRGLLINGMGSLTNLSNLNPDLIIQNNPDTYNGVYDSVRITNNYQLAICNVPALCNYLSTSSAAEIHDNALGCNSIEEIRAACNLCSAVTLKTWNGSTNEEWTTASNWTPTGVPGSCDSVVIKSGITPRPKLIDNVTIHALTMEQGTELYMNGLSIVVNGDVNLDNVLMGGGISFTANGSNYISIENSTLYINNINLNDYKGLVNFNYNSISSFNSTCNVKLNDQTSRDGGLDIEGNNINGNLSVTANGSNNSAYTDIADGDDNYINGNATFIINSQGGYFDVGVGSILHVSGNLTVNSNFTRYPYLGSIDFYGSANGRLGLKGPRIQQDTAQQHIAQQHIAQEHRTQQHKIKQRIAPQNNAGKYITQERTQSTAPPEAHITQLGNAPVEIDLAYTNKSSSNNYITLDQDVYINYNFEFGTGIVKTAANKLLIFKNTAGISQYGSSSYVWGPVKKIGNRQFNFPVGDDTYSSVCTMSAPTNAADEFVVQYFHKNPTADGYDTSLHVPGINTISGKEYWMVNRTIGTSNVQLSFLYDSARSGVIQSVNGLHVARWGGSQWQDEGNGGITPSGNQTFIKTAGNVSQFGPFTFGYTPYHIPIITVGKIDSVLCSNKVVRVPFTVDSLLFTNNRFIAQLSDSNGSFNNPTNIGYTNVGINHSDTINAYTNVNYPAVTAFYKIRVIATSPADTSINSPSAIIKTVPILQFTILGPDTACIGTLAKYYTSAKEADTATKYTWELYGGGGTFISTNKDTAYVNWTSPGTAYLGVHTTNSCSTFPNDGQYTSIQISVSQPPPTAAPIITNTGRWLYSSAPPSGQYTTGYKWYRNDSLISGANNNSYYASLAGTYKVKYYTLCGISTASNGIYFAANSIPQTINFPAIPNKTYGDSDFVINANASSGLPVQFNIVSGPGNIPGNVYHITGTGLVTIRATQLGDIVYDTAAPAERTFTVNKAPQTITFATLADKDFGTLPFNLTATSNSGLAISYTVISGPATINGNIITLTGVGTVTLRASQGGDTNYLASTQVDKSFCVRVATLNTINGPKSICPNKPTTYFVDSIPGATYTWRIAGGSTFTSTTNNVTISWPSPGTYTLIVSAAGNCGAPSTNDSLLVTAITSVQPDSVHNMLPANGAVNQQLPLTLSWIPANPNLYYTYDVYLWRADQSQPSTPYVANLTSVNYTIPLNSNLAYNTTYKWMVAAHNGSCTDINSGPIQQFTLIPLPDLQVYNINAPTNAFSGQAISVTWKVKNNGPGITQLNQHWTDAIFIAKDSLLDFTNPAGQLQFPIVPMLIASKPNVSALNVGESYSDTATFIIPRDYSGSLYMHVVTNYAPPENNPVLETTKQNDTAHALPPTVVTLSPTPDIRVDTIVNPNNTFSGSTINVNYTVKNYGVNAAGSWIDKIYISKDPIFNINNATILKFPYGCSYYPTSDANVPHNYGLQQDSSYTLNIPVIIPNFIYGSFYVYVFTNADAQLYEGASRANNINHGNLMQVFLTPTPKLAPVFTFHVYDFSNTGIIPIGWQIQNQGAYDNIQRCQYPYGKDTAYGLKNPWGLSQWDDKLYISTDSTGLNINTAYYIGNFHHENPILPQTYYYDRIDWSIPTDFPRGTYYLYSQANVNKSVYEYPGTPQIGRSNIFTISWPDLTVPDVGVPANGNSGQTINVNYTLLNTGPGAVGNQYRKDYIYLGNNNTFDGTAVIIDSAVYSSAAVPVNAPQSLQKQTKLPNGVSGSKYIFVRANADSSFKENNLYNNTNTSGAPINIALSPDPDLQVTSINMENAVYTSTGFPFKYTVTNNGLGTASGKWKDSIFISCNATYNSSTSYFVGVRTQQNYIPTGANYSDSFNLVVPLTFSINNSNCLNNDAPQVYFFVKTNADNGVYEGSNNNNNVGGTTLKTIINSLVDHIVTNVTSSDSALVGRYFKVNWTVKNLGLNPNDYTYSAWNDAFYLSLDSVFNANAIQISYKNEYTRLNRNQSYTDSANYVIPNIVSGNYYLFIRSNAFNQIIAERNLSNNANLRRNNSGVPIKVYVTNPPAPDLVDTIITAPASIAVGQPIKIIYTVKNNGVGAAYPTTWYDDIWLSNNLQPGGLYLGQRYHSGTLLPGEFYTDSVTSIIPVNQPQGNYVIVVKTNHDNNVYESNYNNDLTYQYISVYSPAPTDLIVNSITVADTFTLGYNIAVNWNLGNISVNPANGFETDGIYLSKDSTTNTTNDILVGTKTNQLNILPLNSTNITSQALLSSVTEGYYFIKVKTDILNNIIETNKQNNTGIVNHKVYVTIKILPVNIITPDTLTVNYLYYKLIIPTALKGKTISVKLTSRDSLTANNQMYIGLGYLPTAAKFDYAYTAPNFGNQQIVIESVVDSVYYIAVKGTVPGRSYQNINLNATVLPFAILNVNANHGGNTGNVTVQIKGSLFSSSMTAKIRGTSQNNIITASAIYFINGAIAYATFNLQGAPLGVYDVILEKPDATSASLPSGFTIEKGNNGGLLTGDGDNKGQSGSGNSPGCDPGATSGLNSQLQTEVIIPPKVFASWPFTIQINYTNTSNVDVPAQVKILYSLNGAPVSLTQAGLADGKTSLYIEFKDANGPSNTIRAGGSGTINVYSKAPANGVAHSLVNYTLQ